MHEGTEEQRAHIIAHLERLNSNVEKQMSFLYGLRNGVVYGLGFVVGSTPTRLSRGGTGRGSSRVIRTSR